VATRWIGCSGGREAVDCALRSIVGRYRWHTAARNTPYRRATAVDLTIRAGAQRVSWALPGWTSTDYRTATRRDSRIPCRTSADPRAAYITVRAIARGVP